MRTLLVLAALVGPARADVCTASRWCWALPDLGGEELNAVFALNRNDVWAAGNYGALLHWDGRSLSRQPSPTHADLRALWGTGGTLWAVGNGGVILRFDGKAWQLWPERFPHSLDAIWGSAADDIWAVGWGGHLVHWNGRTWTQTDANTNQSLNAVWGTSPRDVWVGGDDGTVLRFDGRHWTPTHVGISEAIQGIWGTSPRDVWLGGKGRLVHWDGKELSIHSVGDPDSSAASVPGWGSRNDLWGYSPNGAWLLHWNGARWSEVYEQGKVRYANRIHGTALDDIWAVGTHGFVEHFDGTRWVELVTPHNYSAVWGASANDVWAVGGYSEVVRWNGQKWILQPTTTPDKLIDSIYGATADDIWMSVSPYRLSHYDGQSWHSLEGESRGSRLWARTASDVWSFGGYNRPIFHWNGTKWTESPAPADLWRQKQLYGLWASASNDAWAVGEDGVLLHWNGTQWSPLVSGTTQDLRAIWGRAANDIWAAGKTILHWDGKAWSEARTGFPDQEEIRALVGFGESVVAVGLRGGIWSLTGVRWHAEESGTGCDLESVWATKTDLWVVGPCGLLRRQGSATR